MYAYFARIFNEFLVKLLSPICFKKANLSGLQRKSSPYKGGSPLYGEIFRYKLQDGASTGKLAAPDSFRIL